MQVEMQVNESGFPCVENRYPDSLHSRDMIELRHSYFDYPGGTLPS